MKKLLLWAGCLSSALFLSNARAEPQTLQVYTWSTYVAPEIFKAFEKETGIKVQVDTYDSNEALMAKLQTGAVYDIVVPSSNALPDMVSQGLLKKLDPDFTKKISKEFIPTLQSPAYDPAHEYSVPLFYGTTGIALNKKLLKKPITSLAEFFRPDPGIKNQFGVLDDFGSTFTLASMTLGQEICDADPKSLKAIQELLMGQKPAVKSYSSTGYIERLAAGDIAAQMGWSGDIYKVRKQNPNIVFLYPKEGVDIWADNLSIAAKAAHPELAMKFIQFIMTPKMMGEYSKVAGYMPALEKAKDFLPADMKTAPEFNIPLNTKVVIERHCPPPVAAAYNKIWARLLK